MQEPLSGMECNNIYSHLIKIHILIEYLNFQFPINSNYLNAILV